MNQHAGERRASARRESTVIAPREGRRDVGTRCGYATRRRTRETRRCRGGGSRTAGRASWGEKQNWIALDPDSRVKKSLSPDAVERGSVRESHSLCLTAMALAHGGSRRDCGDGLFRLAGRERNWLRLGSQARAMSLAARNSGSEWLLTSDLRRYSTIFYTFVPSYLRNSVIPSTLRLACSLTFPLCKTDVRKKPEIFCWTFSDFFIEQTVTTIARKLNFSGFPHSSRAPP